MRRTVLPVLFMLSLLAGCAGGVTGSRAVVDRVGADDFLKLRAGPGLGYRVILGLPDGTELLRGDCTTELGQEWCQVSLARGPGISGYVAADYLKTP
ncbi:SH3 domain-containing protein [Marinovum sp.]|uniref:SH3 domain-containing protein n=1 Tax=Marinovum sp. TaxID=2024839 RepID=UPI003A8CD835